MMQRSKQQAMMFLLGAVLVGSVLGFSADRVFRDAPTHWARRQAFYDDIGLSSAQRSTMDSLLDDRNCQIGAVMKPVRPALDSIRQAAHQQVLQILTPAQRDKLEQRKKEMEQRESKTTNACK